MKRPASNGLADLLESLSCDRGTERDADLSALPSRQSRPECVAKKVELPVGIVSTPVIILAVDDFRLLRMKRQPALGEPLLKHRQQHLSLLLAAAMTNPIIGVTLERDVRILPPHPHIEDVMEKKIRQDGADNPALWRPFLPRDEASIRHLHRCLQPSFDVQKHPRTIRMLAHCPHQQISRNAVEVVLDVQVKNPSIAPASLPRCADRIERRFTGPVSVRVLVKIRLHAWLQIAFHHHLSDSVCDSRNTQRPRLALALRNINPSHRRRKPAAGRHPIPDLIKVVRKISLKIRDRLPIHTSCALVGSHTLIGFPYLPFRNIERLCSIHEAPPVAGWPPSRAEQRNPFAPAPLQSLHHYYGLLRPCAPHRYSHPYGGCPLGILPSHRGDRFPCSMQKPGSASRRLHAGCQLGSNQAVPQTCPGVTTSPRFRHHPYAFDTSSTVRFRSSL